jgi:hypothetical protein
MIPLRLRVAAALLALFGVGLLVYTAIITVPLVLHPDPMLGLEIIVSAMLVVAAGLAIGTAVGISRAAAWARPVATGVALLLILVSGAVILPMLSTVGGYGPPLIDPLFWLLGATGIVLLALVVKPIPAA